MNWLNTKYIIRTGVLTTLLLFPGLISATCKTDTIINNYKPDSLRLVIKADSIIAFHEVKRYSLPKCCAFTDIAPITSANKTNNFFMIV